MEYDFIISPGADPSQIAVQYEGTKSLSIDAVGRLVVETEWGKVVEQRPVIYQVESDIRIPVEGIYRLQGDNSFGFELSSDYDPALPLVIDPILTYSTYLGGSSEYDQSNSIAVDASGAAYVTGYTYSTDFPTLNPYQGTIQNNSDVFVTKLSSIGSSLIYSTYLGGDGYEHGEGIAVIHVIREYDICFTFGGVLQKFCNLTVHPFHKPGDMLSDVALTLVIDDDKVVGGNLLPAEVRWVFGGGENIR